MIVLDTHVLIWWVSDVRRIPARAHRLIEAEIDAGRQIAISSISLWEIAMLVVNGRLAFTIDPDAWLARVEALPFLTFVPVDNRVAIRAVHLEEFPHRDPADRMIVATALGLGATLLTADARLRRYTHVRAAWD
jgi:PIN domain nuclease of toxin-antitoxin system